MAVAYNSRIVTNGLVLCLDAANRQSYPGSGTTWTDISPNRLSGTLTNGPTFSSNNKGAIVFDGTNDHLTSTTAALPSGTDLFTFSIWIYFNSITGSFGPSALGCVLFSGNTTGTHEFVVLTQNISSNLPYSLECGRYGGGTTGSCRADNINMPLGRYHNIVLVRDGTSSNKIYLNGVLLVSGNVSNSFTAGTFHSGGAPASASYSGYLNGRISNILRYNRALSAAEIQQNFNATRGRFGV